MIEDVKGGADDPTESASRRRGLGKGLGAILSAHDRVDAHAAQRDELTGLPNRLLLDDRLEEALARCREDDASLAVLVVSLDGFSTVNDLFGHRVGDDLLRATAERLSDARRKMDTVARFAGDEFVVVCPYIGSVELACLVADRILEDVSRPIVIDDGEHRLAASVGIVVVGTEHPVDDEDTGRADEPDRAGRPFGQLGSLDAAPSARELGPQSDVDEHAGVGWRTGDTVESVLGDASLAMRHAKEQGGSSWKLFEPSMREVAEVRFQNRQDLHAAMEEGGLAVRYEPIVDLRSGRKVGECAFPGWRQPESEAEDPGELLDLIDEAGLAGPICRWVLDEALSALRDRRTQGIPEGFRMWVKVAPSLSGDPALIEAVDEFTAKHGVPTALLGIDVREPQVSVMAAVEPVLQALEERDVALAFDDFGMQPSNLALLPSLPVSRLKLSPELSALADRDDRALVRGLVDLGRALGLNVIAQGVMSDEQAGALRSLGCELAQGAFSVPAEPGDPGEPGEPAGSAATPSVPAVTAVGTAEPLWATPSAPQAAPSAPAARHLTAVRDGDGGGVELGAGGGPPGDAALPHAGVEQPGPEDVSGHPSHTSLQPAPASRPGRDSVGNEAAMRRLVGLPAGMPGGSQAGGPGEPDQAGPGTGQEEQAQTSDQEAAEEGRGPSTPDAQSNDLGGPLFLV